MVSHTIIGATVGLTIGTATHNPYLGFAAAIVSHHVADSILHFDYGSFYHGSFSPGWLEWAIDKKSKEEQQRRYSRRDWVMLGVDILVTLAFCAYIYKILPFSKLPLVAIGIIGGNLPDFIDSNPLWSYTLRKKSELVYQYNRFHGFFHWTVPAKYFSVGLASQIICITYAFTVLKII